MFSADPFRLQTTTTSDYYFRPLTSDYYYFRLLLQTTNFRLLLRATGVTFQRPLQTSDYYYFRLLLQTTKLQTTTLAHMLHFSRTPSDFRLLLLQTTTSDYSTSDYYSGPHASLFTDPFRLQTTTTSDYSSDY